MKYSKHFLEKRIINKNAAAEKTIRYLFIIETYSHDIVKNIIREYVLCKFVLEEEDVTTENLLHLAKISIRKAIKNNELYWDMRDCQGTSESMTKKVLFIKSIEKYLNIQLSQQEYIKLDTLDDLTAIVINKMSSLVMNDIQQ